MAEGTSESRHVADIMLIYMFSIHEMNGISSSNSTFSKRSLMIMLMVGMLSNVDPEINSSMLQH